MEEQNMKKFLLNLIINIAIPILILFKLSGFLGPLNAFFVALVFPLAYGLYEFFKERKINFYSLIGIFGILITAGIGFLKLSPELIAVKEGMIPLVIGVAIIVLEKGGKFMNKIIDKIIDLKKITKVLKKTNKTKEFQKTLDRTTYIFASGFFISAVLNYFLTRFIVVSQPGTQAFNEEYALLTLLNFPAILGPVLLMMFVAFYYLSHMIEKFTGSKIEKFQR